MTQRTVSSSDDNKEDVRRCDIKEEMEIVLFHIYNLEFELKLRLDLFCFCDSSNVSLVLMVFPCI